MATHFLRENPRNDILTASQRRLFNDRMRETVVYIEVENPIAEIPIAEIPIAENPIAESPQKSSCELTGFVHGGGIFYGPHGWILTCAHILDHYLNVRIRCFSETGFRDAEVISQDDVLDIAVLRPLTPRHGVVGPEPYVQFAPLDYVDTGMEVFSIHHALDQVYSFGIGSVAFQSEPAVHDDSIIDCITRTPNFRRVDDCIEDCGNSSLMTYPPHMRVLQLNGIHGDHGSSGCPVFSSSGLLLGIQLFKAKRQNYCNTVEDILTFIRGIRHPRKPRRPKRKRRIEDTLENSSFNKKSKHDKDASRSRGANSKSVSTGPTI